MKDEKIYEQNFKQPKRWSAQRKVDAVMRLFRGEDLDSVSRDLGIESYRLNEWREEAIRGMEGGFKTRINDPKDEELSRAKRQIGELSMEVELLRAKAKKQGPLVQRRSKR